VPLRIGILGAGHMAARTPRSWGATTGSASSASRTRRERAGRLAGDLQFPTTPTSRPVQAGLDLLVSHADRFHCEASLAALSRASAS